MTAAPEAYGPAGYGLRSDAVDDWFALAASEEAAARNSMGGQPPEAVLVREVRALRYALMGLLASAPPEPGRPPEIEDGWYEIELMGHRRRSGYVRTVELARRALVEVTEPEHWVERTVTVASEEDESPQTMTRRDDYAARVEFYSPSAIFSLSPSSEDAVRARLVGTHGTGSWSDDEFDDGELGNDDELPF